MSAAPEGVLIISGEIPRSTTAQSEAAESLRLGELAFAEGDWRAGADHFRTALALEPKRLGRRLLLAQRLAKAGRSEEASSEIEYLATDPGVSAEMLKQLATLEISLGHAARAADLFEQAVALAGPDAPIGWWVNWTNQLDILAASAPGIAGFLANRRKTETLLRCALKRTGAELATESLLTYRLLRVLVQMNDRSAIAGLCESLAADEAQVLGALERSRVSGLLRGEGLAESAQRLIEAGLREAPAQIDLLCEAARIARRDKVGLAELWPQLLEVEKAHPENRALSQQVGLAAYELGHWPIVLDRLWPEAERAGGYYYWYRLGNSALHLGQDAEAAAAFEHTKPRLPPEALGPLSDDLADIRHAVDSNYFHAEGVDHLALAAKLARSCARLRERLWGPDAPVAASLLEIAAALGTVRNEPFGFLAQLPSAHGYVERFDARYGTFDLEAFRVVHMALLEHIAALLDRAASLVLEGGPLGGLDVFRALPMELAVALLDLDRPQDPRSRLQALQNQGLSGEAMERALQLCDLHEGRIEALAGPRLSATGGPLASAHGVALADEWSRREAFESSARWEEGGITGRIDRARPGGGLESFIHEVAPFSLVVTKARDLEVRGAELFIGPGGNLLRPTDWHVGPQHYPDWHELTLLAGRKGALLRQEPVEEIDEPVVALAGADGVSNPNYYHWMIHQLTRAAWASRQGWLDQRRLLVPLQSRPWMFEALRLAGVPEERWLLQSSARAFRLRDAWLVSAFEHPAASMLRLTRERMWAGAEVTERELEAGNLLFLDRPTGLHSPVFQREALLAAVRAAGFQCIEPGSLSVTEQVRLMAGARAVAGFGGSAMTNLMFARDGARVLDLTCETTHWPDFTGIAIALGMSYRYIPCPIPEPCRSLRNIYMSPLRFDLEMLERHLHWARGD